jgi:hypothetical protein
MRRQDVFMIFALLVISGALAILLTLGVSSVDYTAASCALALNAQVIHH